MFFANSVAPRVFHREEVMTEALPAKPVFPISVRFGDTPVGTYYSVEELEQELEVFDSDKETDYEVLDALGRSVRLRVNDHLVLEELSLLNPP